MSIQRSIGWCDVTCNPIKGRCRGGCWYCYYSGKRGILNRFKQDPIIRLDHTAFDSLPYKSKKIFLCSTHDLFGSWIPTKWRDFIFHKVKIWPEHTFQILTKFPQNIDRPMPDNVWLGVTITGDDNQWSKGFNLFNQKAKIKFISFEPLFKPIEIVEEFLNFNWIIVGGLTGYGNKYQPRKEWIQTIVEECRYYDIPIFLKDNLKEIWGEPLIQEFPE